MGKMVKNTASSWISNMPSAVPPASDHTIMRATMGRVLLSSRGLLGLSVMVFTARKRSINTLQLMKMSGRLDVQGMKTDDAQILHGVSRHCKPAEFVVSIT